MPKSTCRESGCEQVVRCKERCRRHYDEWIRNTPRELRQPPTLADRIIGKVIEDHNGCWRWQGYLNPKGYGQVRGERGTQMAHRASYELWVGRIPDGLTIDHLCRVRDCVNPDHLEAVPQRINLLRGETVTAKHASAEHCPRGHAYSGHNLIIRLKKNGSPTRQCRTCRDASNRARYRRSDVDNGRTSSEARTPPG